MLTQNWVDYFQDATRLWETVWPTPRLVVLKMGDS